VTSSLLTRREGREQAGLLPLPLSGLDVDGVLYRWGKSVRQALHRRYGIIIDEEQWFGEAHVSPDQWEWVWSDEGVEEIFGRGSCFPGAVSFARELRKWADVRIITATPAAARPARERWLRARGIPFDELVFVNPPSVNDGKTHAAKSAVTPHCDIYIDDNVGNCFELAQNTGAKILLVDHTWNRDVDISAFPRIARTRSWDEILMNVIQWTPPEEES